MVEWDTYQGQSTLLSPRKTRGTIEMLRNGILINPDPSVPVLGTPWACKLKIPKLWLPLCTQFFQNHTKFKRVFVRGAYTKTAIVKSLHESFMFVWYRVELPYIVKYLQRKPAEVSCHPSNFNKLTHYLILERSIFNRCLFPSLSWVSASRKEAYAASRWRWNSAG